MSEKINNEKRVASIFVDESGNKFDENMFKQSPFFVYAWLLLTKDQHEENIKLRVSELLHRQKVPKTIELRTVKMWASVRGGRDYRKISIVPRWGPTLQHHIKLHRTTTTNIHGKRIVKR